MTTERNRFAVELDLQLERFRLAALKPNTLEYDLKMETIIRLERECTAVKLVRGGEE